MNDFTKKELENIMWAIYGEYPLPIILGDKLQSMIDNYCEHDWKHCYDLSEYDECLKCGECEL
jgi:hypothetical protein